MQRLQISGTQALFQSDCYLKVRRFERACHRMLRHHNVAESPIQTLVSAKALGNAKHEPGSAGNQGRKRGVKISPDDA